ncbi:uncharacterized protein LOC135348062 isoform X2 [Halichondria panicea]|uniref:uncharacterized protein LOC135348062 isoform X2 n=1 Tax=Halichondria panicea TaxID=6063 RepID=UPI00312B8EA2
MIRWPYCDLVVIFYIASRSAITGHAQYSVSVERPCPMETVTFTCTAPGDSLRWIPSDADRITIRPTTSGLNVANVVSGYTVTLIAFNDTTLTSTLSRTAENGINVSCVDPLPTLTTIGSSTIQLVDPPGLPSILRHSVSSSSANEVSVSVQWDSPTETGSRDNPTYTVTISPPAQLSATVLTSTSVTGTAQYNVDYTVSVVATNCAGNSTTAGCRFRIGGCPVLTNPMNGAFGPVSSSLPGSMVTIQCDTGYVSPVTMVTCEGSTLIWNPDPEAIACTPLTLSYPTTTPPINCTAQLSPLHNGTISDHSVPAIPGTQVTFQCDGGLFPEGIMTVTCLATGEWDRNTGEIVCRNEPSVAVTRGNVAAVAGGVIGGIVALLLIILGAIVLLIVLRRMGKESIRLKSNDSMDTFNYQPPVADEEDYSRITHDLNPASLTYDEVTINSEKKIGVNAEGYSVMNSGQSTQRLPGYGQLGNVATLEPVVYAVLSSSQKNNTTSTAAVNQHQVTYATVDVDATKKQSAKAANLPASPTAPEDVDKLLDIDQALVQIRSMKHKWRELAESVRLPETMIEQIEESCCNDSAGCLTEVINQWSCSEQPITWRELADHLSKIGEEQLSKDLMTIHGTSCLPVELNSCLATPNTSYKYDKTPLLPSKSPTVTDDSPGLLNTLTPSRPPKSTGEMVPPRPPKPAPNNEPPALPHPMKQYAKH